MPEDLLLMELCMICHIKPHKYCCPRCWSRTCSLPCSKRHKQWASCNGLRDPAAYIKRKDLATPKSIDHDYNYLTSIERQLDSAERHAKSRGILLYSDNQDEARRKAHKPAKGEVPLQNAIKQNRRIVWTVEWVHKDGSREIGRCPDQEPLDSAYAKIVASTALQQVTKAESHKGSRKRPRLSTKISKPAAQPKESPPNPTPLEATQAPSVQSSSITASPPSVSSEQKFPPQLNFYLLLPCTPTSYRVLIPLSPKTTLSTALTDRFVLEFPTIYALKQTPDKLPMGFMTEEEYVKGMVQEGHANHHLESLPDEGRDSEHHTLGGIPKPEFNEVTLKDVLKKDLISVVDAG
ncbi:MAG: hypothetical protein Q9179_006159 [Wetmoreana sp. 5 TL-2023]